MKKFKKPYIYLTLIIFVLLSSFSFYFFYSPRFTLYLIQQSITNKDKEAFLKYVDVDMLVEDFVKQILLHESEQEKSENPIQKFKSYLKQEILENIKPVLKDILKQTLLAYFNISTPNEVQSLPKELNLLPALIYFNTQYKIKKIQYEESNIALVEYEILFKNSTSNTLKLKFEKANFFYWKLIAIPNLYEFLLNANK